MLIIIVNIFVNNDKKIEPCLEDQSLSLLRAQVQIQGIYFNLYLNPITTGISNSLCCKKARENVEGVALLRSTSVTVGRWPESLQSHYTGSKAS